MGGTDENNITDFVINTLNEIKEKFQMIIVVGGGYPYLNQLKKSLSVVGFNYDLYQNPDNIAKIMSQADFAIISFGQTAYELVALEVPMLYLCITQDHLDSSQLFENNKIGESLGIYPFVDNSVFINKVTKVIKNNDILEDMVNSSKSLNISNLDLISKIILKGDKYV